MVGFGSAFVVGWLCQRTSATLTTIAERTTSSLWLTLICFVITAAFGFTFGKSVAAQWLPVAQIRRWTRFSLTPGTSTSSWSAFAKASVDSHSLRRYCTDSSYWLHIAHLPLVTALQVIARGLHWHWSIELTLIRPISIGLLLLSYTLFVRATWLGAILNGARRPPLGLEQPVAKATA